jgi:hypothetical protein
MHVRLLQLALLSALLVLAAAATGYLLSTPTEAAPGLSPHIHAQRLDASAAEADAAMSGRERPTERPSRDEFDDPGRRMRASSIEALLHRHGTATD